MIPLPDMTKILTKRRYLGLVTAKVVPTEVKVLPLTSPAGQIFPRMNAEEEKPTGQCQISL